MVNLNLIELAEYLAMEECKRIYGDDHETLYKNNYDQFTGYVMRPAVKLTYNKMYNKYYDIITILINKKDNEI
jgi:hypothetical protein